MSKEFL